MLICPLKLERQIANSNSIRGEGAAQTLNCE
eukprot:UN07911